MIWFSSWKEKALDFLFLIFYFMVLGFELRASCLVGSHSITQTNPSAPSLQFEGTRTSVFSYPKIFSPFKEKGSNASHHM
jgi:hypothetical protein